MKINKILLTGLLVTTLACSKDEETSNNDTNLQQVEIPTEIKAYKNEHFPSNDIINASKNVQGSETVYDLKLSGAIELEFDNAYRITDINGATELPTSVIPQTILDYVAQNYPNNVITDWEIETNHQEIELDNGLDLEFQMDGTFLRVDEDDDDNDTSLTQNEVPAEITAYINQHFPNNTIVSAVEDVETYGTTYDITLSGAIELEFDENYAVTEIESTSQLPASVIPQSILDYVAQNYSNNVITSWELEGTHQQVELNNGTELDFQMNGTFIGTDNDDNDDNDNDDDDNDENETNLSQNEIPAEITAYVNQHFSGSDILQAVREDEGSITTYDITLSGATDLEFNANYDVTDIESATQLPNSVIQQALLDYVAQNYPNNTILSWELEVNHQQIELNNDLELEFQMNGTFIRIDND